LPAVGSWSSLRPSASIPGRVSHEAAADLDHAAAGPGASPATPAESASPQADAASAPPGRRLRPEGWRQPGPLRRTAARAQCPRMARPRLLDHPVPDSLTRWTIKLLSQARWSQRPAVPPRAARACHRPKRRRKRAGCLSATRSSRIGPAAVARCPVRPAPPQRPGAAGRHRQMKAGAPQRQPNRRPRTLRRQQGYPGGRRTVT
jgi:hypothetical protein